MVKQREILRRIRHSEIGPGLAEAIYKQAEAELGKRWWWR